MYYIVNIFRMFSEVILYVALVYGAFLCWKQYLLTKRKSFIFFFIYCSSLVALYLIGLLNMHFSNYYGNLFSDLLMKVILVCGIYSLIKESRHFEAKKEDTIVTGNAVDGRKNIKPTSVFNFAFILSFLGPLSLIFCIPVSLFVGHVFRGYSFVSCFSMVYLAYLALAIPYSTVVVINECMKTKWQNQRFLFAAAINGISIIIGLPFILNTFSGPDGGWAFMAFMYSGAPIALGIVGGLVLFYIIYLFVKKGKVKFTGSPEVEEYLRKLDKMD